MTRGIPSRWPASLLIHCRRRGNHVGKRFVYYLPKPVSVTIGCCIWCTSAMSTKTPCFIVRYMTADNNTVGGICNELHCSCLPVLLWLVLLTVLHTPDRQQYYKIASQSEHNPSAMKSKHADFRKESSPTHPQHAHSSRSPRNRRKIDGN
jgi:hypothetical protein